jgi:hypothetical protein
VRHDTLETAVMQRGMLTLAYAVNAGIPAEPRCEFQRARRTVFPKYHRNVNVNVTELIV